MQVTGGSRGSAEIRTLWSAHNVRTLWSAHNIRTHGACNRLEAAVERTVPFGFLVQSLLIVWYARFGYDPSDVGLRRLLCPWYRTKQEPAVADMLAKLRREFLKARFSAIRPGHSPHDHIEDYTWTCGTPAA